jgi:tetratricopeptide (TPR) repeat protein
MCRRERRVECVGNCAQRVRSHTFCAIFLILSRIAFSQINHIEAAARLLNEGQVAQAEVEARQALQSPATRALALAMLGTIRLQQDKYDEGTGFLTQALAINPKLVGARTSLGNAYVFQGKPELAEKSFREVLKLDPHNFAARFDLAKLEASRRNFYRSLEIAGPIAPQLTRSDEGLLLLATDYGALGKGQELKGLLGDWKSLSSPTDELSLQFGNLLVAYGLNAEAREILDATEVRINEHPSPTLTLSLANAYLSLGVLDHAQNSAQLALSLTTDCVACYQTLAQIAERQENSEKALSYLVAAKRLDPENPEILFEFGKVCLERNLVDDALPALTKAVALRPDQDSYVYVLGSANVARGNLTQAASVYAQLLQKHQHDAVLNYAMGAVYYLQAKYTEAELALKQSLEAQPDQVAASYYLALTYNAIGDDGRAIPIFRELIQSHPQHVPSYVKLGGILVREHQYEEAQRDLERAVALDPDSVEAHYQLGLLLRRVGKPAESESQFAESRRLETEQHAQKDMHLRLLLPD